MKYTIGLIDKKIAKELIIKNHYSHKWTSCRYAIGLFDPEQPFDDLFNRGKLIGVAIYGFPVGRQTVKSITPNLENSNVLELTGIGLVVCGEICSNISDTQMSTLMYVTGGIFVVTGAILHLDSYKWMKKAYIIPIENGIAVGINIEF